MDVVVAEQLRDRDIEDAHDLRSVGVELGPGVEQPDEGSEHEAGRDGGETVELSDDVDVVGIEADLFVRLTQRGVAQRAVPLRFELPTGKGDLAAVRRHGLGPFGEDDPGLAARFEDRDQHRGGTGGGRRRRTVRFG